MAERLAPRLISSIAGMLVATCVVPPAYAGRPLTAKEWYQLPENESGGRIGNDLLSLLRNRWLYYDGEWNSFYGTKLAMKPRDLGQGLCGADILTVEYDGGGTEDHPGRYATGLQVQHRFRFLSQPVYDEEEDKVKIVTTASCDQLKSGPPWSDWMIADSETQIRELAVIFPTLAGEMKSGRVKEMRCEDEAGNKSCKNISDRYYVEDLSWIKDCSEDPMVACYRIDSQPGDFSMVIKTDPPNSGSYVGRIRYLSIGPKYRSLMGLPLYQ